MNDSIKVQILKFKEIASIEFNIANREKNNTSYLIKNYNIQYLPLLLYISTFYNLQKNVENGMIDNILVYIESSIEYLLSKDVECYKLSLSKMNEESDQLSD